MTSTIAKLTTKNKLPLAKRVTQIAIADGAERSYGSALRGIMRIHGEKK